MARETVQEIIMKPSRTLRVLPPLGYLQLPAIERRRFVSDLGAMVRRAESAGCEVVREGNEVTIAVPEGVDFDLRGLR